VSGRDEGSVTGPWRTPSLGRRMTCFMYEGVLLFGVVWAAGMVYSLVTGQRHAMTGQTGMQLVQFVVLGAYFTWFWSRTGQTLPMQTWNIRVVTATGAPLTRLRAACRYLVAWLWFLPALAAAYLADIRGGLAVSVILLAGVLTYAMLTLLHPRRQFLHDAICGTQLVEWKAPRSR
jgi:uncharacterized RDD family membrane protein YckC